MKLSETKLTPQQEREARQKIHLDHIDEAFSELRLTLHAAEGSAPPTEHQEHVWSSRRMSIAATHLEIAEMFARKAATE
jgi:hypothetical protein